MGDRFYMQQNKANGRKADVKAAPAQKPKRRLKADIVSEIDDILGVQISSLKNMTVADLETLKSAIEDAMLDIVE